jgi:hypothetical protein
MNEMPFLAIALLLGSPTADLAPAAVSAGEGSARVTVVAVSDEPGVVSGILATFVRVTGRAGGGTRDYLLPFFARGQPRPAIGATCTFIYRRFEFQGHVGPEFDTVDGGDGIVRYRCDGEAAVTTF